MPTARSKGARSQLEDAVLDAFPFLVDALGISALGLLVPSSLPLRGRVVVQLTLISVFALYLAYRLLRRLDPVWFEGAPITSSQRAFGTALGVVVIVTGSVGLVALASSAALRLRPPTQLLQLLSALDIAWAATTVMVASFWLWNRVRVALLQGAAVVALCVFAYYRYVDEVAFGPSGAWRLRASELWEYVLVYDIAIAVIAIALLVFAVRRKGATL